MNNGLKKSPTVSVIDIAPILEHYGAKVPTRRGWASIRCPFHDDRHSSATVNTSENVFCCFACQVKGNTYNIIMSQEGLSFHEAVKFAERVSGTSSKVLFERNSRGGGLPRRTGNQSGSSTQGGFGRRSRSSNGA